MSETTIFIALGAFVVIGIFLCIKQMIYINKTKMNLFSYYMDENGPSDSNTIKALTALVQEMWEEKNQPVENISIVHETGHKYQCFLTSAGVNYTLDVIANSGNVHYTVL